MRWQRRHGPAGDLVGERVGRILPALPGLAVQAAELPALRRVNPVKAYPLAVDFERVAVDHRGRAGHVGQGRSRRKAPTFRAPVRNLCNIATLTNIDNDNS